MRPKRRDGHEGWTRSYAAAWDRVFGPRDEPVKLTPRQHPRDQS